MRVETAIKMIEDHGHKAFVTPEGLACVSEVVHHKHRLAIEHVLFVDPDDCVFEEVTTFEFIEGMRDNSTHHVRADAIEAWLGY